MLRLLADKSGKFIVDQFTNRRTRHQHAFIDVKFMATEPGFVGQVGHRNALVDAANHALNNTVFFAGGQTRGAHVFRDIQRQVERRQHQLHGFIPRVVSAVAVPDIRRAEAAHRPAQHVLNGLQLIYCFINENFIHVFLQGMIAIISAASLP